MSRKTRKLIWSAPLVAVLAVAGTLAMFLALAPGGVLADSASGDAASGDAASHLPPDPATGITVTTPSAAEGGRTALRLSWNAPVGGDAAMTYRVDVSEDAQVWHNVTRDLSNADAEANCTASDTGNRCFTAGNPDRKGDGALMPDTEYHFRVFAINNFGTSGISVNKTTGAGETLPIEPPDPGSGLAATNYYTDKIELEWQAPADDGGADIVWYCINITSVPDGPFNTADEMATDCLNADNATTEPMDVARNTAATNLVDGLATGVDDAITIVVAGDNTNYPHEELGGRAGAITPNEVIAIPNIVRLRYQVWVVTDDNGAMEDGRRMSLAASNVATGSTVAPPGTVSPRAKMPQAPTDVRIVAYSISRDSSTHELTDVGDAMHLYWNTPGNFPEGGTDDPQNWDIEVERVAPDGAGGQMWVPVIGTMTENVNEPTAPLENYATAQFSVNMSETDANLDDDDDTNDVYGAPTLIGDDADSGNFRVRYVNPGANAASDNDNVNGQWGSGSIMLPLTAADYIEGGDVAPDNNTAVTTTMPFIVKAAANGANHLVLDAEEGLRFTRNATDAKKRIDLRWRQDTNANMAGTGNDVGEVRTQTAPTRYVIDRSEDGGITWESISSVQPLGLGTTLRYTDSRDIVPGMRYTYRVFPVFIGNGSDEYGWPAEIHASSEQADVPAAVQGLKVDATEDADGNQYATSLTLTWNPVTQSGGHDIEGYLVQVSVDVDDNKTLDTADEWRDVHITNLVESTAPAYNPTTVGADPAEGETLLTYNYVPDGTPVDTFEDTLSAGDVRWFRVFAITDENEGITTTGGEQVSIIDGSLRAPLADAPVGAAAASAGEMLPTAEDLTRATPEDGQTADLTPPGDDQDPTPPSKPLDVTAEKATDANTQADSDRGVFLTWNEDEDTPTPIASYAIERKRMNTGVEALNNDKWEPLTTVTGATSFTDSLPLRQPTEMRYYRVGSNANNRPEPNFADAVMYSLHGAHAPDAPSGVSAMADDMEGRTTINVSWMAPASDGGSDITGYMVQSKYGDGEWMDVDPAHTGTDRMYMDTGLMSGITYYYRVRAMNAVDYGEWSDGMAMAMTEAAAGTTLGDAMGLTAGPTDDNDPAAIKLTWDAGANATTHTVVGVLRNADGTFDTSNAIWMMDVTSPLIVEMGDRPAGNYIFGVVAGLIDGTDREWSDWARARVAYQQ